MKKWFKMKKWFPVKVIVDVPGAGQPPRIINNINFFLNNCFLYFQVKEGYARFTTIPWKQLTRKEQPHLKIISFLEIKRGYLIHI